MVVTIYPSPGTMTSSRFTATVNGSSAHVHGYSRAAGFQCFVWNAGETIECSWLHFAANETTTVRITRLAGAVTSAIVYPKDKGVVQSIVGGVLTLTVPPNTRFDVEINGDRKHIVSVFASPPLATPPGAVDWTTVGPKTWTSVDAGTDIITFAAAHGFSANQRVRFYTDGAYPTAVGGDLTEKDFYYVLVVSPTEIRLARTSGGAAIDITSTGGGSVRTVYITEWPSSVPLVFPAGAHRIGRLFRLAPSGYLYFSGGAVVHGSIDTRTANVGGSLRGHGVLEGSYATRAEVAALPTFAQRMEYILVLGHDGVNFRRDVEVEGLTMVGHPYFTTHDGVQSWRNAHIIGPWDYNCDGFDCSQSLTSAPSTVTDCYAYCADDSVRLDSNWFTMIVTNLYTRTNNGSSWLFGYWGGSPQPNTQQLIDCDALCIAHPDYPNEVSAGGDSIIKLWVDNNVGEEHYGRFNIVIRDCKVWGPMPNRLFSIETRLYPYSAEQARAGRGHASNIVIERLWVEQMPGDLSRLNGMDWRNTPHDIDIYDSWVAGVRLRPSNWALFVSQNAYPFNIRIGGQPVVTQLEICNRALAAVGDSGVVTSVAPSDGTRQAELCKIHYPGAVNAVLEMVPWAFATRRVALVEVEDGGNDAWPCCYEVPEGMLCPIGVLPEGAADDWRDANGDPAPYVIEQDDDDIERIYTKEPMATLRYTAYVTDAGKFTPTFVEAVVWHLASQLSGPIVKGEEGHRQAERCLQRMAGYLGTAATADGRKRKNRPRHGVSWMEARQ